MEKPTVPFNTIIITLMSIVVSCFLFIGLQVKALPPFPGGLLIILFGALPHTIGLKVAIRQDNTPGACIIGLFCLFWWYIGVMLTLMAFKLATKEQYNAGLAWLEPAVALLVFVFSYAYRRKKSLFRILLGLGSTVFYLWLSKTLVPGLEGGVPLVVGALGAGSVWVLILQLKEDDQKRAPAA